MVRSRLFLPALAGLFLLSSPLASAQGRKPWLGVYLDQSEGGLVEIQQVLAGSPAEKAGLKAGDLLLACNQTPVPTVDALIERVHRMRPGQKVSFRVLRNGKKLVLTVTLGTSPEEAAPPAPPVRPKLPPRPARPSRAAAPVKKAPAPRGFLRNWNDLEKVLQAARKKGGGKPVLLEFNAPWCGPGRVLEENLSRPPLSQVLKGFFGLYKVDVDQSPALADRFKVDGIPHLQVIDDRGRPLGKVVGAVEPVRVAQRLRRFLPKTEAGPKKAAPKRVMVLSPVRKKAAPSRTEDTNKRILQELIRIRKLLEEIKNRVG